MLRVDEVGIRVAGRVALVIERDALSARELAPIIGEDLPIRRMLHVRVKTGMQRADDQLHRHAVRARQRDEPREIRRLVAADGEVLKVAMIIVVGVRLLIMQLRRRERGERRVALRHPAIGCGALIDRHCVRVQRSQCRASIRAGADARAATKRRQQALTVAIQRYQLGCREVRELCRAVWPAGEVPPQVRQVA